MATLYNITEAQHDQVLNRESLRRQNMTFRGSGGVSEENRCQGFAPAFLDTETGHVYPARFADGRPAPMHLLDGLPDEVVVTRLSSGRVSAVKSTVIAGFMRHQRFFTRERAARAMRLMARMQTRWQNAS